MKEKERKRGKKERRREKKEGGINERELEGGEEKGKVSQCWDRTLDLLLCSLQHYLLS